VGVGVLAGLLLVPLLGLRRRRGLYANLVGCGLVGLAGCGGGGLVVSTVRTTPPGTYQYQVTASSTGGNVVTSSVMLTLVVQ
jgi:ABC-type transporter Mla subunit MlaD